MKLSYVYILSNKKRSLTYIGVTSNLYNRVVEHKSGKGSVFTAKYHLTMLLYFEEFTSIDQAIAREKQLKNWHKQWKWNLIKELNPELEDLFDKLRP
ncbi:GIY-YIG nuclease family protein [Salinimicrobium xinjiangense]|uniref:GIY-YIG nuclease family protein n=1 Tax=Salinimicrobium xinjiangense TaxID=438596 RepID=UPI000491590D|nr:GIY-YIG nuclease family protein [Salinimicrobium xinjiangense]